MILTVLLLSLPPATLMPKSSSEGWHKKLWPESHVAAQAPPGRSRDGQGTPRVQERLGPCWMKHRQGQEWTLVPGQFAPSCTVRTRQTKGEAHGKAVVAQGRSTEAKALTRTLVGNNAMEQYLGGKNLFTFKCIINKKKDEAKDFPLKCALFNFPVS